MECKIMNSAQRQEILNLFKEDKKEDAQIFFMMMKARNVES